MSLIKRLRTKLTLFLIGGVLTIIYSIPMMVYSFTLTGGASLIALLYIYSIGISILALVIDQILVNYINFIRVSIIEAIVLFILYMGYLFETRTAYINIQSLHTPYLIVIDSQHGISKKDFSMCGLFNIQYDLKDKDLLFLDKQALKNYNLVYKIKDGMNGTSESYHYKPEYNFDWDIILPSDSNRIYSDKQEDSLLKAKLPPNTVIHNPNFKGY